jgi:DNA-binding transcriptional LysR family regulator
MVQAHLEAGELAQVLPEQSFSGGAAWAIYPSKHHLSPKVRVFLDFLVEDIKQNGGQPTFLR